MIEGFKGLCPAIRRSGKLPIAIRPARLSVQSTFGGRSGNKRAYSIKTLEYLHLFVCYYTSNMKIVDENISISEIKTMAEQMFGDLVKAVVDLEEQIISIDAELHADLEALMLKEGSKQQNLWGINLYPELFGNKDFIEFDSMINLRPSSGNKTRGVDDIKIQEQIIKLINKLVKS